MNALVPSPNPSTLADAVARVAESTVGLMTRRRGLAAGVVWKPGVVLSSASAIGQAEQVQVVLPSGQSLACKISGIDAGTDIAVLTLPEQNLAAAERRLAPAPRVGDFVFAVGRDASATVQASFGHIGKTAGSFRTWRGGRVDSLLRLDGGLYPGLAGAPVADAQGQLLGIASPALSRHHGVVLPLATLERVAAALLSHGHIARGYLGVAAQAVALTPAMQSAAGTPAATGLLIAGLADEGPAARAGVLVGDVLWAAAGQPVGSIEALHDVLGAEQIGARLRLQLLRGGQPLELAVDVADHPGQRRC
jgi:serine protease Do